jgi:manganese-transporting P-type ATPase
MVIDFIGCYAIEVVCKALFADLQPKSLITRGSERRMKRRAIEIQAKAAEELEKARAELEKKGQ